MKNRGNGISMSCSNRQARSSCFSSKDTAICKLYLLSLSLACSGSDRPTILADLSTRSFSVMVEAGFTCANTSYKIMSRGHVCTLYVETALIKSFICEQHGDASKCFKRSTEKRRYCLKENFI